MTQSPPSVPVTPTPQGPDAGAARPHDNWLRHLVDAIPHLAWAATSNGRVEYYNARISAYGGLREDDGTWRWQPLVHEDDAEGTAAAWRAAAESERPYEFEHRLRMADGYYRWHLSRAVPVRDGADGDLRWYGTATDIHELRMAQEEVRRTQGSLQLAMRGGRMGWWSRDLVTNAVTWSPELEEIFGLPAGSFGGREDDFWDLVHEDDRVPMAREIRLAIEEDRDYHCDFRYRHGDGSWRWMEGRGLATGDPGGPPTFLFGIGIDITERKRADELRDLFVGMLSHELRTPVTAIFGGAQLLTRDDLGEAARREITEDVVAESERLERLVENLLVVARADRGAEIGGSEPVLLRPLVQLVLEGEGRSRPATAFTVDATPGLPPARGDEASIELCLRNLVSNALKYGPPEGPVDITIRGAGELIEVAVGDRGPGLPDDAADRLFELFYRTADARRRAPGAGIGLYVVRALVESLGGRVRAENRAGGGASFVFTLPVYREAAPSGRP